MPSKTRFHARRATQNAAVRYAESGQLQRFVGGPPLVETRAPKTPIGREQTNRARRGWRAGGWGSTRFRCWSAGACGSGTWSARPRRSDRVVLRRSEHAGSVTHDGHAARQRVSSVARRSTNEMTHGCSMSHCHVDQTLPGVAASTAAPCSVASCMDNIGLER
jgi:hypothetical protein